MAVVALNADGKPLRPFMVAGKEGREMMITASVHYASLQGARRFRMDATLFEDLGPLAEPPSQ